MNYTDKTNELLKQKELTEKEINLICRRLNNGQVEMSALEFNEDGYNITQEQTSKGLAWLVDQWKTPRGIERKNNPFGYREQEAIEKFTHFTLEYIFDAGNSFRSWYVPVWGVHAPEAGFQYYVKGGQPEIIG